MPILENGLGKEHISDSARHIGDIYNAQVIEIQFLDLTIERFNHFDEFIQTYEDPKFSEDFNYILQTSIGSFTSKNVTRFSDRIDAYFYIYRRLEEYIEQKLHSNKELFLTNLQIFREKFYGLLSSTFASSNGIKPNLCTTNVQLIGYLNIPEHLSYIKPLNSDNSKLLLALCKLSMQSSLSSDRLQWINIFSRIHEMNIPLDDLILEYLRYLPAFQPFLLDTSGYIHLIQRRDLLGATLKPPLLTIIVLLQKLNLPIKEFFDQFLSIFEQMIEEKHYETKHITILLSSISRYDYLFEKYLCTYSSMVSSDDLWNTFIDLSINANINETMKKHLIAVLTKSIRTVTMETFSAYAQSIRNCLTKVKSSAYFREIFDQVYDAFITMNSSHTIRLKQSDVKELLNIALEFTSTRSIRRPSCLLLLREYLFKLDNRMKNIGEKIQTLFENFSHYDESFYDREDPRDIIDDDWLKDYLITNTQIWLKLDDQIYRNLCKHHRNNPWIIHIWSRIVHLSLEKYINDNPNQTLVKFNQWMQNVQHDHYDPDDNLTIIVVEKLFQLVIKKHIKAILSFSNVEIITNFLFSIPSDRLSGMDEFIEHGTGMLRTVFQLQGTRSMYRDLLNGSILASFLPRIDFQEMFTRNNQEYYRFPAISNNIDLIISLDKPDIDTGNFQSFTRFLEQINQWYRWFDRFCEVFRPIFEWLKTYNLIQTHQFSIDFYTIRNEPQLTLIDMKTLIEKLAGFLEPIIGLHRLCYLFNCLNSFRILDRGTLNTRENIQKYLVELKRLQPNNTFSIQPGGSYEHVVSINDRQHVQWSLASGSSSCDIEIIYQTSDEQKILFKEGNVAIHRQVLHGQFESSQAGRLRIILKNTQTNRSCPIWYRLKATNLPICQLFQGIFHLFYAKFPHDDLVTIDQLNQILSEVFTFIDKLSDGSLSLRQMKDLQTIFCDQSIHIANEVKKLYHEQINDNNIEQVCQWLRIYQYYSHINIIIKCIELFDILPVDQTRDDLRRLAGNEDCSLREITDAFRPLEQRFRKLSHQHLQLIKTAVDCANVVKMMKKADFYSNNGQRRFQDLKDNLTTQFQYQERNNMILNSWIMTHTCIEPFVLKATNFDEFISRVTDIANFDESSLNHMKIVNENIQIVDMWISGEELSLLDNALITMEHLFKTGRVYIYLRHLMNESSYFEVRYSVDRNQEKEISFTLSMNEIDDHKRQLIFGSAGVEENIIYRRALINGQLKLFQTVEKIYTNLIKLELSGHPNYQSHEEQYDVHLHLSQASALLADLRNHQDFRLENAIKDRIENLGILAKNFEAVHDNWMENLRRFRHECSLLKLFSNRQIMFLIILLRTSASPDSIRHRFLKKIFSFKDLQHLIEEENQYALQCLMHYLRSLRIHRGDFFDEQVNRLYANYQIEASAPIELCLKRLSQFLRDLFGDGRELLEGSDSPDDYNQQYLVAFNPLPHASEKITLEHQFDMQTCCVLLNIFRHRLPATYQILWASDATIDDIELFFARIRAFPSLIFVIMNIDQMHHRLREILFNEQTRLTREAQAHGTVYYFSRELANTRKGLREFHIKSEWKDPKQTYRHLLSLQKSRSGLLDIQIVYGTAGIGKTHRINTHYQGQPLTCFSINDRLDLSWLINSLLFFDSNEISDNRTIYFNISIHAPFEILNRALFCLFICGSLKDDHSGLTFALPMIKPWRFVIEIPYSNITQLSIRDNFDQILPILSVISSSNLVEITNENYPLFIGEEEELVARFLEAFEKGTIDRMSTTNFRGGDEEVKFDPIPDPDRCRSQIQNAINRYAPHLLENKIDQLSLTKFLYRRVRYFLGYYYRYNQTIKQLGSIAMRQMISEASALTRINFRNNSFPRIYLLYDPFYSLRLLHNDWNQVSPELKSLFDNRDPLMNRNMEKNVDYFVECLSWLIDIPCEAFVKILQEAKFILTENFAYKLFHVHERKLTKLALIIEGDTGVGKTFLLKFYSLLLNSEHRRQNTRSNILPRIVEHSSAFLHEIINDTLEQNVQWLNQFIVQIRPLLANVDANRNPPAVADEQEDAATDAELLTKIKLSLTNKTSKERVLHDIWKTMLNTSIEHAMNTTATLIQALHDYITTELANYPLIEASHRLTTLLQEVISPTVDMSIEIFEEYLFSSPTRSLYYRLLLHPGITEERIIQFMSPISQLARELPQVELVVFFDEVNTSSCLGLFKEMFMDGTLHGKSLPKNIFFTAAINPLSKPEKQTRIHRTDYLVHQLPQSLEHLKVIYGPLESRTLSDYIAQKFQMLQCHSAVHEKSTLISDYHFQAALAKAIIIAHEFCEEKLGKNSVSQREIQRCFNLIEFFTTGRYGDEARHDQNYFNLDPKCSIALSIALIYYFRLPTKEDNVHQSDTETPTREQLAQALSRTILDFEELINDELLRFVNEENFVIPQGVAINQAVREHIFAIVVSIVSRTPLCIIGTPGQSKTLSFQIVLQNLQGSQVSPKSFCRRLPAIEPFLCLGSKYTRSEDIDYTFERAIKREQQYREKRRDARCVVFLDEASLPNEKKMVMKALHPYLDECKVAFIAVANHAFDAANANRMICIYRSLPSENDQKILAYGCLGLQNDHVQRMMSQNLKNIISGLCQGYRRVLATSNIPSIFHDRDLIYMLRELRFELANIHANQETSVGEITPRGLLRALEQNFNGIRHKEFERLLDIFFSAVNEQCPNFQLSSVEKQQIQRNIPTMLCDSMRLDPNRRRLYGRYKLIIDESEDESAVRLLSRMNILDFDPDRAQIFRMSDFPDDINNELGHVEILSTIKLCMETGKTIVMVNTGRIHGSLYDVFNQNFSLMATDETRKIFSKVAIGPKTIDVVVHEDFQCIVHINRKEFKDIPAPFLSRFQKYSLSIVDFYHIELEKLPEIERNLLKNLEEKIHHFIDHFGSQYFYGFNDNTLYSCLLWLIQRKNPNQSSPLNIQRTYTQLTIKSKSFIEQNAHDLQQSLLFVLISKFLQLVSPESMIYKLPTFKDGLARSLCQNYFYQQEHFNLDTFLQRLISPPSMDIDSNDLLFANDTFQEKSNDITIITKVMIFTRTSPFVLSLSKQTQHDLFHHDQDLGQTNLSEQLDILNLITIENSSQLTVKFDDYQRDKYKKILLIIIDARINEQCLHIPYVRQLIDKNEQICNTSESTPSKFFVLLVHSSAQEVVGKSSFPSIFLANWDYYFLDTSPPGNAFHLQKILQTFTSSFGQQSSLTIVEDSMEANLCDYHSLLDDCLWDVCSRIQIFAHQLPKEFFGNSLAYEFYQVQTSTNRRVFCLKELLQQLRQFQERLVTNYHQNQSKNQRFLQKKCHSNYQISKEILCGKRFTSLVDSFQSDIRLSFTNYISHFFKYLLNDYGLQTLVQFSSDDQIFHSLLNLIDVPSNNLEESNQSSSFILQFHYSFIPQTPLFHLFHERIQAIADDIKSSLNSNPSLNEIFFSGQIQEDRSNPFNQFYSDEQSTESPAKQFRNGLIRSLLKDKLLLQILSPSIVQSYTNDSIRRLSTMIKTNFNSNLLQYQKTVEFLSKWLLTIDEEEENAFDRSSNRDVWLLAHVYTKIEYEQQEILSLYSACLILESLDQQKFFRTEETVHSRIRDDLFRSMFEQIWIKLVEISSHPSDHLEQWIYSYTLICKYYPSTKVLQRRQLLQMKGQIEMMHLAYLIFLNEKTPQPVQLVAALLRNVPFMENNADLVSETSVCVRFLPAILRTMDEYFQNEGANNSSLMIDLLQWILSIIKSSEKDILYLFQFFHQPIFRLSMSMKQFLFDGLANILMDLPTQNQSNPARRKNDFWDRLCLLPSIVQSLPEKNLQNYRLPYHPSVLPKDHNHHHILLDLYFFHLQRLIIEEPIKCESINKILLTTTPRVSDRNLRASVDALSNQLRDYFAVYTTALLLCQSDVLNSDAFDRMLSAVIQQYLSNKDRLMDENSYVRLFFAIIISKRSWAYVLAFLQSELLQRVNREWADRFYSLFQCKQMLPSLQIFHRLHFTITTNTTLSIFPQFHQPYHELSALMEEGTKMPDREGRWTSVIDWIGLKLNDVESLLTLTEIKVMLLLNIYYDYYCFDQLKSLDGLLETIEKVLQPTSEELRIFRVFLQPEIYMIGYPHAQATGETNELNNLFRVDCQNSEELSIRHSLVNLLAMILLSGKQNFLWTFAFEPSKLQKTFGFGSARHEPIKSNGAHYDCGCVITENGDIDAFLQRNVKGSALTIPTVYVAIFSTFGALTWHLLLSDRSTADLYGPLLTKGAIDETKVQYRLVGKTARTKVCHFIRARLLSTYHFLTIHFNETDACIILNRCFERMARLTTSKNAWIKPIYPNFHEKIQAEQKYQNEIFYFIHQQLGEYKNLITRLSLESPIQEKLQDYISQMPCFVQFTEFKTELSNPNNARLPLDVLRFILQSFDHLKITHLIYDLTEFYLLLHRTYGQMLERNEFSTMTLKELHERAEKQLLSNTSWKYQNSQGKYLTIIENGIKAVNAYHQFTNGMIQPGACDKKELFTIISMDTPISYLVTTENHDEGDIIMRILSNLVDFHNRILDTMERDEGNSLFKNLISQLTSGEIPILQIVEEKAGVIVLTETDCLWIEELSRASIENDEYFLRSQSPRNFNFLHVQSSIIRSYLFLCRINYRHIAQKYPFYTPHQMIQISSNEYFYLELEDEWNHLKDLPLDQLDASHRLLQRIDDLLKGTTIETSGMHLYQYLRTIDQQNEWIRQCEENQIKDFPLVQLGAICRLFEKIIHDFQHSFVNVPQILRMPIDTRWNVQLDEQFQQLFNPSNSQPTKEKLQESIRIIRDVLNEFKEAEQSFLSQSSESLKQTCQNLYFESSILQYIPEEIKCQNYVPIAMKLTEIRSKLQENILQIEEENAYLWDAKFESDTSETSTVFQRFKNPNMDLAFTTSESLVFDDSVTDLLQFDQGNRPDTDVLLIDFDDLIIPTVTTAAPKKFEYVTLFELTIKTLPLTSSRLFQEIREQIQSTNVQIPKALHYTMVYPDQTTKKGFCKIVNLSDILKRDFDERRYPSNQFVMMDQNHIVVDWKTKKEHSSNPSISAEYRIVEKTRVINVILQWGEEQIEYFVTDQCHISSIIKRFIADEELTLKLDEIILAFFDELGRYIEEDSSIDQIYRTNDTHTVRIRIIQCENDRTELGEIIFSSKEGLNRRVIQNFSLQTTWRQIGMWVRIQNYFTDALVHTYQFWNRTDQIILDQDRSIFSTFADSTSLTIDGINNDDLIDILLSYDQSTQKICVFRSAPVSSLLQNPRYRGESNSNDYSLRWIKQTETRMLSNEEMQQSISSYAIIDLSVLHFQICICIELIPFDHQQTLEISLSHRNLTIEEFLHLESVNKSDHHLASIETQMIIPNEKKLSEINGRKFQLVPNSRICSISIEEIENLLFDTYDQIVIQQYIIHATIADICKQNHFSLNDQSLQCEKDFIPSSDTPLTSLLSNISPIQFQLIQQKYPVNMIVHNEEEGVSVQFACLSTITTKRVRQIACRLLHLNDKLVRLTHWHEADIEENYSFNEQNAFRLKLKLIDGIHCRVIHEGQTIIVPSDNQTLALTILKESLKKFAIPEEHHSMYELVVITDEQRLLNIDFGSLLRDIQSKFYKNKKLVSLQLRKT